MDKIYWSPDMTSVIAGFNCIRQTADRGIVTQIKDKQQTDRLIKRPKDRQIDRQTHRQTLARLTNKPTDRQTGRQTDRQTDRKTDREKDR